MSKVLSAAFHRLDQWARPLPVGSRLQMVRYNAFNADCSVGKWPRALTARRNLAFMLSMALVVHTIRRISTSKPRNGTISAHALVHNRVIAGYLASHLVEKSANASNAACSVGAEHWCTTSQLQVLLKRALRASDWEEVFAGEE